MNRRVIGLIFDKLSDVYEIFIRNGIKQRARELDCTVICFSAGELILDKEYLYKANVLYELVHENDVDAFIVLTASICNKVSFNELERFIQSKFSNLPIVSIGQPLGDFTSIVVDNKKGMFDGVVHLIREHGKKNIAFIQGPSSNKEALERFEAYKEALASQGIAYNAGLVCPGEFSISSGERAVEILLYERKVDFDAVVGADDTLAWGAIQKLGREGKKVPGEIGVIGFDDITEAAYLSPPLTTIRQPLWEQGIKAVDVIMELLDGGSAPKDICLPTELIIRHSCNCLDKVVVNAGRYPIIGSRIKGDFQFSDRCLYDIFKKSASEVALVIDDRSIKDIALHFYNDLTADQGTEFLKSLNGIFLHFQVEQNEPKRWHNFISHLRHNLLTMCPGDQCIPVKIEALCHQARIITGSYGERIQAYNGLHEKRQQQLLQEIGHALITSFKLEDLREVFYNQLPSLGIHLCYVVVFVGEKRPPGSGKIILAFNEDGPIGISEDQSVFDCSKSLLPDHLLSREKHQSCLMVMPLYYSYNDLGYVILEANEQNEQMYEAIASYLSASLQCTNLFDKLQEKQQEEMRRLQKEMEIARQIQTALLPVIPPVDGYEISAVMYPADDVGGDYYDFYTGPDGRRWFAIGDVTGHGLTAGLIMLMAQSAMSSILKSNPHITIEKLYADVNALLYDNIRHRLLSDHFMTLSIISVDKDNVFTAAGSHLDPLIYRKKEAGCTYVYPKALWAGLVPDLMETVEKTTFTLESDDILFLFTDGLIEARDASMEQYNKKRLEAVINKNCCKSTDELRDILLEEVFDFMTDQDDDISFVIVKRV